VQWIPGTRSIQVRPEDWSGLRVNVSQKDFTFAGILTAVPVILDKEGFGFFVSSMRHQPESKFEYTT
jgi:hypothetical protein